jgi:Fe-S-cluster containining protein
MTFNCEKLKLKCKAACCGPFPIQADLWERLKHKAERQIISVKRFISPILTKAFVEGKIDAEEAEHVYVETELDPELKCHRCPFLSYDYKCNIYDDRPFVCREFGTESNIMMKCGYQDKDGRERSRQQRRAIDREQRKCALNIID